MIELIRYKRIQAERPKYTKKSKSLMACTLSALPSCTSEQSQLPVSRHHKLLLKKATNRVNNREQSAIQST